MPMSVYEIKQEALWPSFHWSQKPDIDSTTTCFSLYQPPQPSPFQMWLHCVDHWQEKESGRRGRKRELSIEKKVKQKGVWSGQLLPTIVCNPLQSWKPKIIHSALKRIKSLFKKCVWAIWQMRVSSHGNYIARKSDSSKGGMDKRTAKEL